MSEMQFFIQGLTNKPKIMLRAFRNIKSLRLLIKNVFNGNSLSMYQNIINPIFDQNNGFLLN